MGVFYYNPCELIDQSLINQNNRTLNIRASVPNKEGKLLPGGFAETILQFGLVQQLIIVPQTAVVYAPDGTYIFKVVDGKAKRVVVTLGERDADSVIVKSGIKSGDVIVIAGQLKLHEGAPVVVAGNKKPALNK